MVPFYHPEPILRLRDQEETQVASHKWSGQKWEYKKVGADYRDVEFEDRIQDLLDLRGREGWELVMGTPLQTDLRFIAWVDAGLSSEQAGSEE
jgi:hypothetical protein